MMAPESPSWRKPVGALAILLLILVWCALVLGFSDRVGTWAWPLQMLFYLGTGIVWIAPLKPLLRWMELGRWRA
jgi:hypothetical protein